MGLLRLFSKVAFRLYLDSGNRQWGVCSDLHNYGSVTGVSVNAFSVAKAAVGKNCPIRPVARPEKAPLIVNAERAKGHLLIEIIEEPVTKTDHELQACGIEAMFGWQFRRSAVPQIVPYPPECGQMLLERHQIDVFVVVEKQQLEMTKRNFAGPPNYSILDITGHHI